MSVVQRCVLGCGVIRGPALPSRFFYVSYVATYSAKANTKFTDKGEVVTMELFGLLITFTNGVLTEIDFDGIDAVFTYSASNQLIGVIVRWHESAGPERSATGCGFLSLAFCEGGSKINYLPHLLTKCCR